MFADFPPNKNFYHEVTTANFIKNLGEAETEEVTENSLTLKMFINPDKHLNSMGNLHGGFILSLADMAMGGICLNFGRRITTLDLNINFIKRACLEGYLKVTSRVIHNGGKTMVTEAEVYDSKNALIAKARATFFVLGNLERD